MKRLRCDDIRRLWVQGIGYILCNTAVFFDHTVVPAKHAGERRDPTEIRTLLYGNVLTTYDSIYSYLHFIYYYCCCCHCCCSNSVFIINVHMPYYYDFNDDLIGLLISIHLLSAYNGQDHQFNFIHLLFFCSLCKNVWHFVIQSCEKPPLNI